MNAFPRSPWLVRYPIKYIDRHFQKFFKDHFTRSASIWSNIQDENEYMLFRGRLLALTTRSEHARATRIASQMDPSQIDYTIDPLVKLKLLKRQRKHNSIIIHYKYERRFAHYKSRIHQIWNATFPPMSAIDTKLIVGTRNNPNLTKELVRRSPYARTKQEKPQTRSS